MVKDSKTTNKTRRSPRLVELEEKRAIEKEKKVRMSTGGQDTTTTINTASTSSLRKRHSPNSNRNVQRECSSTRRGEQESGGAAAAKHRRTQAPITPASSLHALDNKPPGRVTRSKARAAEAELDGLATPDISLPPTHVESEDDEIINTERNRPRRSRGGKAAAGASSSSRSAVIEEQPATSATAATDLTTHHSSHAYDSASHQQTQAVGYAGQSHMPHTLLGSTSSAIAYSPSVAAAPILHASSATQYGMGIGVSMGQSTQMSLPVGINRDHGLLWSDAIGLNLDDGPSVVTHAAMHHSMNAHHYMQHVAQIGQTNVLSGMRTAQATPQYYVPAHSAIYMTTTGHQSNLSGGRLGSTDLGAGGGGSSGQSSSGLSMGRSSAVGAGGQTGMLYDPLLPSSQGSSGQQGSRSNIGRSSVSQQVIHGLHSLVPRMQHLLGGHKPPQHDTRIQGIMDGLRSSNELRQAEAAGELAEWLLMANEDNLPSHLPIRDITHALIQLLQKEHNFELMLTSARCLTNLLEAVPRSQAIVVDAVPHLLEKLKRIECIDVAEQALTALEELSKRNSKTILMAGGIAACISHVDFFSVASQRLAFSIAANCAMYLSSAEFAHIKDSLGDLTERLLIDDKRCLDSVCQLFARLVENLRNHPDRLREIAGTNFRLLALVQQLLIAQPSQLSSNTFSSLVRMLRTMAGRCPDLAAALIRMDYQTTLRTLFTGTMEEATEIIERPPHQLQDMVYLVGELLPRLPVSGVFEIDSVYAPCRSGSAGGCSSEAAWYWQDNSGHWQPFRANDSRIIEQARNTGGASIPELQIGPNIYLINLDMMTQRNVATGMERPLQRRPVTPPGRGSSRCEEEDGRLSLLRSEPDLMERVVAALFPVLVAIDASSCGPALRYECLRVMLRMVCPMGASTLRTVLVLLPLSGHIASALASPRGKDLCIVVAALQLVHLLLEKLSDVYSPLFRKEGVAHQVQLLAAVKVESKSAPPSGAASPALGSLESSSRITRSTRIRQLAGASGSTATHSSSAATPEEPVKKTGRKEKKTPVDTVEASGSSSNDRAHSGSGTRHRKRGSPDGSPAAKKESRRKSSGLLQALRIPGLPSLRPGSSSTSSAGSDGTSPASTAPVTPPVTFGSAPGSAGASSQSHMHSFIAHMVSMSASSGSNRLTRPLGSSNALTTVAGGSGSGPHVLSNHVKDQMRAWIKKEAELLLKTYLGEANGGGGGSVIDCLQWVAEQLTTTFTDVGTTPLTQLHDILSKDTVSAFEMTHSGVISALHTYLVSENSNLQPPRRLRLKRFAAVFMHLTADNLRPCGEDGCFAVFESLVTKTLASVSQLEQFQVKVNDLGGIATSSGGCLRGAQALRFFQSHQIKCYLRRHPACHDLRDYHRNGGNTIKVDPFTSMSAIERYLLDKGICRPRGNEESSGDDLSDEEESANQSWLNGEGKKIEILIGEQELPSQMSVLQALRQYAAITDESGSIGASLWTTTHTLYYRTASEDRAAGGHERTADGGGALTRDKEAPKEKKHKLSERLWNEGEVDVAVSPLWSYLEELLPRPLEDPSIPSLLLLRTLYGLNQYWYGLFDDEPGLPTSFRPLLSPSVFHSTKLAAKMSRQLGDFISVATQQIPQCTIDLVATVPFLFPFALRRSMLYCTSFGRERALMHLVSQSEGAHSEGEAGGRLTPRLERRKITIKREELLKCAESALASNASARAMLEVSFEGEAGTGFGPTLEFYSTVSRELQNATHKLWHGSTIKSIGEDGETETEYVVAGHGLYPTSSSHHQRRDSAKLKRFEMLGRLMGQALVDCRMLDLPLSPVFLHWLVQDPNHLGLSHMEVLDPVYYKSLRALTKTAAEDFEDLEQYFTMPGNESFELMKGGKNIPVTIENVHKFIQLVSRWRLAEGVWREMEAVKKGFQQVIDPSLLHLFMADELDELFCGCSDDSDRVWGEAPLAHAIKPDHGYTHDSEQIRWLIQMLTSFDKENQRKFVQFVTGSPRLPVGGFRALNPPLTVVRKTASYGNGDEELPSAMTCYNYLKVPAYSSYEVFCERFAVALRFIYSFHLT